MKTITITFILFATLLVSCNSDKSKDNTKTVANSFVEMNSDSLVSCSPRVLKRNTKTGLISLRESQVAELSKNAKQLDNNLPIIGVLMYDDVLTVAIWHEADCERFTIKPK